MKHLKKPVLFIFFATLLATPWLISRYYRSESGPNIPAKYGVAFEDVTAKAGVTFKHISPTLDRKLDNIMPIVASMGAGVSVTDFDRDGWNDLYFTNSADGSQNALYHNNKDGTFTDVAATVGLADMNRSGTGVSMGSVWADYDNDGFEDVFLYKWGRPELFHNDAGKAFTRVTDAAGFPSWMNANTAIWFDYDADGLVDLFVGGYFPESLDLWHLENTKIMAESFEYAKNGGRKFLFRNLGGGKFDEVSKKLGIETNRWALAAGAADFFGTGKQSLFIANDYGVSELYENTDRGGFVDSGVRTGVGAAPKSGMGVSFGDIFNTGKLSIYVSNISEEGILLQGNNLWVPDTATTTTKYSNQASTFGVEFGGWSWGSQFGDLNNDGFQDLFVTNGFITGSTAESYWYDYSKITPGNNSIIADAANWAPIGNRSLAGKQSKRVWLNDGAGRFNEVARSVGVNTTLDGRAVVIADLWNRGVLDIVLANQNGPPMIYRNSASANGNWLDLELTGTASNKSAIGAEIRVFWDGKVQLQTISGGIGFASQNQRRLHFGLGSATKAEKVEIRWPSGKIQSIVEPKLNFITRITEE